FQQSHTNPLISPTPPSSPPLENGLSLHNIKILKEIGAGIGKVYLCKLINNSGASCYCAMKVVDKKMLAVKGKVNRAETEEKIMKMLDHPFLSSLYAEFEDQHFSYIVMEYCSGGDLNYLRHQHPRKQFLLNSARFYAGKVLLALEYLHMLGIIYRDLKPENVLVKSDGHIMLTNFDLLLCSDAIPVIESSLESPDSSSFGCFPKSRGVQTLNRFFVAELVTARSLFVVSTHEYVSPEMAKDDPHGNAVDRWAYGVFIYEMIYGRTPFVAQSRKRIISNIVNMPLAFPTGTVSCEFELHARELITALLVKDLTKRLGAKYKAAEVSRILKEIGAGIGKVYLCKLNNNSGASCYCAMKVVDKKMLAVKGKVNRAEMEEKIMKMLDHPFLSSLYAEFEDQHFSYIVMEYCSGGDLNYLRHQHPRKQFSLNSARFYAGEVLLALEYLHMLGIIYRDLKPKNVLVNFQQSHTNPLISPTPPSSPPLENGLSLHNFKILKEIGAGIGKVYLCKLNNNSGASCYCAMKVVDKKMLAVKGKVNRAEMEEKIIKMLDHPFLSSLYAEFEDQHFSYIVMEYCSGGDLNYLRHQHPRKQFSLNSARFYAGEVLLALEYLHMLGIIYRDLKPKNVLVKSNEIGAGIGKVYLCKLNNNSGASCYCAMKVVDKKMLAVKGKVNRAEMEEKIMKMLDHPFLSSLYAEFEDQHFSYIVMEYCSGGDLNYLRHQHPRKQFSLNSARFYAGEVLLALEYLHMLGIIYRDLKPKNVLVKFPYIQKYFPKSRGVQTLNRLFVAESVTARSLSVVGTHEYVSPEMAKDEPHGNTVDWWAYGVFIYEMIYGRTLFVAQSRKRIISNIVNMSLAFPAGTMLCELELHARELITALLVKDPIKRLGAKYGATEVKKHPFFKGLSFALIRSSPLLWHIAGLRRQKTNGMSCTRQPTFDYF
ncbi:hypothetical protein G4B88_031571, partial [Cannabis sativa]